MIKQIKWPLILIFAAFSFSSIADFNENPRPAHVAPKSELTSEYECASNMNNKVIYVKDIQSCIDYVKPFHPIGSSYSWGACDPSSLPAVNTIKSVACWRIFDYDGSKTMVGLGYIFGMPPKQTQTCPPPENLDYSVGPNPIDPLKPDGPKACFPVFKPCPLGFYANAVASMPGQPEQCVPIQCPSKGQAVNNIKNLQGIIPAGQTGTYCDGLCNYSIQTGGISYQGQQFASGVSLGTQCGQSPISGQKFTPLDKEKSCTEHTLSSGAIFLECTEGTDEPAPDPNNPDLNLDAKKVDPQPTIDPFTGIECTTVEDKMSCVGKNVTDAITKQTKDEAKLAAERHNKLLEAQKEITEYVERQQRNREEARKNDAVTMVEAIQEVNRTLQTGGGVGGGTGTIVGLEGLVSAVEGIGEGVNETSVQTDSEPTDGIQSFYEAEYPNGFQDVWQKNKAAFENTEMNQYLDSWKLTATGAAPPMQLCFNVIMDFGCSEFVIDPRVFPFLRIIMLVSTAFLCRALIFGG